MITRRNIAILLTPLSFFILFGYFILSLIFESIATNNSEVRTYANKLFRKYHVLTGGFTTYLLLLITFRSFGKPKLFKLSEESLEELNELNKYLHKEAIFYPRLGSLKSKNKNFKKQYLLSEFKYHQIISDGKLINDSYPGFNISQRELLSSPFLWRFLTKNDFENKIVSILGKKKNHYLVNINAWMVTHLNSKKFDSYSKEMIFSSAAQTYHYDYDLIHFCKVFINLSNTNIDDGPFEFVDAYKARNIPNPPLVPNSFRGKTRVINIPKILIDQKRFLTGPTGSTLVCPTFCIHRDGRPKKGNHRIVLQLEFATTLAFSEKFYGLQKYSSILRKLYDLNEPAFMSFLNEKSYLLRYLNLFT
tara:strand:- start:3320 stop:4405 length:1086 start_codon:yes stop_codon:yes gene_type:complete